MGDNILIAAVLHEKAAGDNTQPYKAQLFIEMQRGVVICHYCIELQYPEPKPGSLFHAVRHQGLTHAFATHIRVHGVACVADMTAAADIVGMENVDLQALRCQRQRQGR